MTFQQEESRRPRNVTMTWPSMEPAPTEPEPMLPPAYDRTGLYLLVRDPLSLYAFWSIGQEARGQIGSDLSKVLRIYEVINGQSTFAEVGIGESSSWYFTELKPDTTYYAELGLLQPDGGFVLIARSNQVRSPRNSFSEVTDEEWLTIDELYGFSVGLKSMRGSEEVLQAAMVHLEEQLGSEAISSFSSPWAGYGVQPPVNREADLLLEATTIVTIHGKITPGASLQLNGQALATDESGHFVYSLPLPDGEVTVRLTAASPDHKIHRESNLEISRRTR